MSDIADKIVLGLLALFAALLLAIVIGAAVGVIPTGPEDPCIVHHAKAGDQFLRGWQRVAGHPIWCGR